MSDPTQFVDHFDSARGSIDAAAYLAFTDTVAVYPKDIELPYLVLGIVEEVFEMFSSESPADMLFEGGDVLWYAVRLERRLGYAPGELITNPDRGELMFERVVRDLCGACKKTLRDNGGDITEERLQKMSSAIRAIVSAVYTVAAGANTTVGEIIELNIKKLTSRQDRGTLAGDGDHR